MSHEWETADLVFVGRVKEREHLEDMCKGKYNIKIGLQEVES
jgi:hypothetical protein